MSSALRRRGRLRAVAPVGHELVELGLVLGHTQALEEFAKLALLVLETAQRLGAVVVEGAVAARSAPATETLHLGAHAIHFVLHAAVSASAPANQLYLPDHD